MKNDLLKFDIKSKDAFICGDIHGEFNTFRERTYWKIMDEYDILDESEYDMIPKNIIFVCGDIGLGFYGNDDQKQLIKLSKSLKLTNTTCIFIRGNHDDPEKFNGRCWFDNIYCVKDYTVISLEDANTLCIGGGLSIDRIYRSEGKSYWKNELPVYNEELLSITKDMKMDSIVTHTSPSNFPSLGKDIFKQFSVNDPQLEEDHKKERGTMDKILEYMNNNSICNCTTWHCGHFHRNEHRELFGMTFICHDMIDPCYAIRQKIDKMY